LKTKLRGRVKVVQDENDESNVRDDVFQVTELVDPYRVAPSIDLEKNSNFRIFDNIFVDVDTKKLNVVLNSSRQEQVDEDDDNNEINIEDCNGVENESIKEEEDYSD
jgi:hypothetical protein